jgi:hypothetical protein
MPVWLHVGKPQASARGEKEVADLTVMKIALPSAQAARRPGQLTRAIIPRRNTCEQR